MLAVALLAMVGISVYRFVETTLTTIRVSTEADREHSLVTGFANYVRRQMQALPCARAAAISGEPHRFNGVSSDELRWIARPGSALLTRHASGEWLVTLTTKKLDGSEYELGVRRQDAGHRRDPQWLPLFRRVLGFEVRYFDPDLKQWMEKWADLQRRPSLVRIRLWREASPEPFEWVLPIPAKAQPTGGGGA